MKKTESASMGDYMLKVVIFGYGLLGKKLISEYQRFDMGIEIVAVSDNNIQDIEAKGLRFAEPASLRDVGFDEIWITAAWFREIQKQLTDEYSIPENCIHFIEPVLPALENRIRNRYFKSGNVVALEKYKQELAYLKNHHLRMYCYPFYDEYLRKNTMVEYDRNAKMFYGLYENKRMYLSKELDNEQKARAYFNAVTMEQDSRCPHCYWNNDAMRNVSGVGIDVGAAEGIFGLKIIEQVEHLYMIEVDKAWIEALQYTYKDYAAKVTIINKFIGNTDDEPNARIDTLFRGQKISFMKMDIEGMESDALEGADEIISSNDVACAICVYHHPDDNECIGAFFEKRNYTYSNSEGFVISYGEWELEEDNTDFRKALLFAERQI